MFYAWTMLLAALLGVQQGEKEHQGTTAQSSTSMYMATHRSNSLPPWCKKSPFPFHVFRSFEEKAATAAAASSQHFLFDTSATQLEVSSNSSPLKIYFSFFLPRNQHFCFVYPVFVLPHCPLWGQNSQAVGSLPHTLAGTCEWGKHCHFHRSFFGHGLFNLPPTGMWIQSGYSCLQSFRAL